MKTIKKWFLDTLPEDIAKLAIKNTPEKDIEKEKECFEDALYESFIWDDTEEGFEYWSNIDIQYNK